MMTGEVYRTRLRYPEGNLSLFRATSRSAA